MKHFIVSLIFSTFFISASFGQTDADYTKTLKKMFEVTGTEENYKVVISQMFTMMRNQSDSEVSDFLIASEKELLKLSLNEFAELHAPIYKKYLSIADLEEMIKFYLTPTGQKFAKNTPIIAQESMPITQQWSMKVYEKVSQQIKENTK